MYTQGTTLLDVLLEAAEHARDSARPVVVEVQHWPQPLYVAFDTRPAGHAYPRLLRERARVQGVRVRTLAVFHRYTMVV
jgi:hypothetical protein